MANTDEAYLLQQAAIAGAETGAALAKLRTMKSRNAESVHNASIGWVARLPLDNYGFERLLRDTFESSALTTLATQAVEAKRAVAPGERS